MKIAVIGTGYVGLVTGTCFADSGNSVVCLDIDDEKVAGLRRGEIPIYEPGLSELVLKNSAAGRLAFTTSTKEAVEGADIVMLAVGTPPAEDGSADLSALRKVVDQIAPHLHDDSIVVTKSTVPVGTCAEIERRLHEITGKKFNVASNPEFLKEGAAIEDFTKPDRVVVGVRIPEVGEKLKSLYAPFVRNEHPFIVMSPESSEMTKYVANALLATKISFINEVANLCEQMEADIDEVRRGIGHDRRIGFSFLFPGVGYGGSCFPKDVQALMHMCRKNGVKPRMLEAANTTNLEQKKMLGKKVIEHFAGNMEGRRVAVWGLAFKPKTDDTRDAPSIVFIDQMLEAGAAVRVHDPVAMENIKKIYGGKIEYAESHTEATEDADCLAILTEWGEYMQTDLAGVLESMRMPVVFDGRNLFKPEEMRNKGFVYHSMGRL